MRHPVTARNLELARLAITLDNLLRKTERLMYEAPTWEPALDMDNKKVEHVLRALSTARDSVFELSHSIPREAQ